MTRNMEKFDKAILWGCWALMAPCVIFETFYLVELSVLSLFVVFWSVLWLFGYEVYMHGYKARECALLNQYDRYLGLIEACETYWRVVEED